MKPMKMTPMTTCARRGRAGMGAMPWSVLLGAVMAMVTMAACGNDAQPGDVGTDTMPEPDVTWDASADVTLDVTPENDIVAIEDTSLDSGESDITDADVGPELYDDGGQDTTTDSLNGDVATQGDTFIDAVPNDTDADEIIAGPCANQPPLALADVWLEPFQFTILVPSGGSGNYTFRIVGSGLGAAVNADFGTFLASRDIGDVVVRVSDADCQTSIDATVRIVAPLVLQPGEADIEPVTGRLQFERNGGSGEVHFTVATSSATVARATISEGGLLTAGDTAETLLVQARDLRTGRTRVANVRVRPGSAFRIEPAALVLPVGGTFRPTLEGGSQSIEVVVTEGGESDENGDGGGEDSVVAWENGQILALEAGQAQLAFRDRHTDERISLAIDVVASPDFASHPAGDRRIRGSARVADLDGDGLPEALVAIGEADIGAVDSGGVFVYAGIPGGFSAEPAMILTSSGRGDELGGSMALGDFDNDGFIDIAIGVLLSDIGGNDRGHVQLHRGRPGDFFDPVPLMVIGGETDGDQFGQGVGLCDLNADGHLDLIATGRLAEDENATPIVFNVGTVHVFLGSEDGFRRVADQVIFGAEQKQDGTENIINGLALGVALATGDVDADGYCDIAVSSVTWGAILPGASDRRTNDGAVFVFRGRGRSTFGPGGLHSRPALFLMADDPEFGGGQFGTSVALGDVDGDGRDDLLIGEPDVGRFAAGALRVNTGAATLWRGADVPTDGSTRVASVLESPWRYSGRPGQSESADRFGFSVAIGDLDGVPPLDVFVAARFDEQSPWCVSNCGAVHALAGAMNGVPTTAGPEMVYPGRFASQEYGIFFAVAPDFDGDGSADLLVRAGSENDRAPRLGRNLVQGSRLCAVGPDADPTCNDTTTLGFPITSAGSRIGASLTPIPDLDGDGYPEVAVGGWRVQANPAPTAVYRPGDVALYRGGPNGVATAPFQYLAGFAGQSTEEAFGHAVRPVAGIGAPARSGVLVVARLGTATVAQCGANRSNVGAAWLFVGDGAGGLDPVPRGAFWGPQVSQQMQDAIVTDINGDGLGDVIVTGPQWDRGTATGDNAGGFAIYFGNANTGAGSGTTHRCTPDAVFLGASASDALGTGITRLGDVNGDGCDDVAIGAQLANAGGAARSGFIYIFWGYGGATCAFQSPHTSVISPGNGNSEAGAALAAADIDGDGRVELAVGGRNWRVGSEPFGAVWLVAGTWLRDLAGPDHARPWADATPPAVVRNVYRPNGQLARLRGSRRNEEFGASVSLIGAGEGGAWLAVGRPLTDISGVDGAGGASVYSVSLAGENFTFSSGAVLAVGGETSNIRADFARAIAAWRTPAGRTLAVGVPLSRALGLDDGGFFVTPPR